MKFQLEQTKELSIEKELTVMLESIRSNRRLLNHLFREELSQELADILLNSFVRGVERWMGKRQTMGIDLQESTDMLIVFLAGGLSGMVMKWISEDFVTPIDTLARCQHDLLLRTLNADR